ncbi:hypothetical protein FKP32DRAFT_993297 [Trametes sanguinea]|nr:hypothetical protein FKP32DRAFT_993297 [Trametes sanguinea]
MKLTDVADDVLLEICSYLFSTDALNLALASKQLLPFARPRIVAISSCSHPTGLVRIHDYLLSGTEPLASHVRYLYLKEPLHVDPHISPSGHADASQASLVGDILLRAHRLQKLVVDRFQPLFDEDPRIGTALQAMMGLKKLRLGTLGDKTLSVLRACTADIERLTLVYYDDDCPLKEEKKTFDTLLATLAVLRKLVKLKLFSFTPAVALSPGPGAALRLPSITRLLLEDCSPMALDLVHLCPNLAELEYSMSYDFSWPHAAHADRLPHRWPELRRLTIGKHWDVPFALRDVGTVDRLGVNDVMLFAEPEEIEDEIANLRQLLRLTSPNDLFLWVMVSNATPLSWREVAEAAPNLHSLRLRWNLVAPVMAHRDWLVSVCGLLALALALMCRRAQDGLPRLLSPLKISALWLHLSKTMSPAVRPVSELNGDATDAQKVRVIEARQMELDRLAVMPDLPRRLAEAIPSLRYLAIVDDGPNLATLALPVDGDLSRGDSDTAKEEGEDLLPAWPMIDVGPRYLQIVADALGSKTLVPVHSNEWERAREEMISQAAQEHGRT